MSATTNRFEVITLERLQEIYDILSTSPPGAAVWGTITGTLSAQLDLQAALNLKYDASNPSGYITTAALSSYLTIASAAATYYPLTNPSGYTNNTGTVTSVQLAAGTGISLSGTNPVTTSGTITVTNSAPDQTVALSSGTGISVTGTYPNFTITNTSPSSGGTVTAVTGTAPIASSGGTTPAISISQATTSTDGYLSSTDWNTFNGKQAALVSGTSIKTINSTSLLGSGNVAVEPTIATGTTLQYWRGDKSWQTLPIQNYITTADGTAITATTTSTKTTSILIPANTIAVGDVLNLRIRARKTGTAGTQIIRAYFNTADAIGGSLIATSATNAATTLMAQIGRALAVKSATNTESFPSATGANLDDGATGTAVTASNIDWTVAQYLVIAVQNSSTADTSRSSFVHLQINKA